MIRRVHIDRLELDLRGIPAATAQRAVDLLGPALGKALAGGKAHKAAGHVNGADAGRISTSAGVEPQPLARKMARRIAATISGGVS
jgi:hypothetical protein